MEYQAEMGHELLVTFGNTAVLFEESEYWNF